MEEPTTKNNEHVSSADFYQVSVFCLFLLYMCAIRIIVFYSVQFEFFPLFCVLSFYILPYEIWICWLLVCAIKMWGIILCAFRLLAFFKNLFHFFMRHILSKCFFLYKKRPHWTIDDNDTGDDEWRRTTMRTIRKRRTRRIITRLITMTTSEFAWGIIMLLTLLNYLYKPNLICLHSF